MEATGVNEFVATGFGDVVKDLILRVEAGAGPRQKHDVGGFGGGQG